MRQAVHDIRTRAVNQIRGGLKQDYAIVWNGQGFHIIDMAVAFTRDVRYVDKAAVEMSK